MILAIDPGSYKTGLALLEEEGTLVDKKIVETTALVKEVEHFIQTYSLTCIAMGNGTNHQKVYAQIEETIHKRQIPIAFVEESFSTQEGKARYFVDHPPKGIWKWIPLSFQSPKEPVDDYGAWIIGERYIKQKTSNLK